MTEIIPIRSEDKPITTPQTEASTPTEIGSSSEVVGNQFTRSLIPPNTATLGRSVKLRDVFSVSGAVASDSSVVTITANGSSGNEKDLKSFKFFPNEWHVGMCVRITATGIITCDATRTVVLRIGSGLAATTEWNSMTNVAGALTNAPWNLVWYGVVTTLGASGTLEAQMTGAINNVGKDDANTAAVALATTSSVTVALTADWSANTAGNSVSVRQWVVEVLY